MLRSLVKSLTPVYRTALAFRESRRRARDARAWTAPYLSGGGKIAVLRDTARAYGLRTLVETGTYEGETTWALRRDFDRIYTVELSDELYRLARARFAHTPNVDVRHGDSATVLPAILDELSGPALFWLDAHVSTTKSAHGELPSPAVQELELVLAHPVPGHVVLVDDARLFTGRDGWPAIADLEVVAARLRPELHVAVEDDIVRLRPG
jgi:hypothetical protein